MLGETKSYSEAMKRLEAIVGRVERGEVDVDELCASVTEAAGLVRSCRERLRSTQEAVEQALREMDDVRKPEAAPAPTSAVVSAPPLPSVAPPAEDDFDPFADA